MLVVIPQKGERIKVRKGIWHVPNHVQVPFIIGDGIGVDITPAMIKVVDAAVKSAYGDARSIVWFETYAGSKARSLYGEAHSLPAETLACIRTHHVCVKGPLQTPVGTGIRSVNVALRQALDLYTCLRPVRYFAGVPSPMKNPEKVKITVFRENSEDIYAGIEFLAGSKNACDLLEDLSEKYAVKPLENPDSTGVGIKVISEQASKRLVDKAIRYALLHKDVRSVTLVHKGNIMKYTEGAFREWGYQVARQSFGARPLHGGPWHVINDGAREIIIKDVIADAFFQAALLYPSDFDVVATTNLNGDYLSDALAAQVGGVGIAPGVNQNDRYRVYEATHGTAPDLAGKNEANPLSIMLSAEMMLRDFTWHEAADGLLRAIESQLQTQAMTSDLAANAPEASVLSTSAFVDALLRKIR